MISTVLLVTCGVPKFCWKFLCLSKKIQNFNPYLLEGVEFPSYIKETPEFGSESFFSVNI